MYTTVRILDDNGETLCEGHAYDISEGGMRFELDDAMKPGSCVTICIDLPGDTSGKHVLATCNILWVEEEDLEQPGPVRMACSFTGFTGKGDAERLAKLLVRGRYHLAA